MFFSLSAAIPKESLLYRIGDPIGRFMTALSTTPSYSQLAVRRQVAHARETGLDPLSTVANVGQAAFLIRLAGSAFRNSRNKFDKSLFN